MGIIELLTLIELFNSIYKIFENKYQNALLASTYIVIPALIIAVWFLYRKDRRFRLDLIEKNSFIQFIVKNIDPEYTIKTFHETHEILDNKSGHFYRHVVLSYTGKDVLGMKWQWVPPMVMQRRKKK